MSTLRLKPAMLHAAALTHAGLVVDQGRSISVYDATTGKRTNTWAKRAAGALVDADSNIALYIAGRVIHLLDLSLGHDVTIRTPGTGPVLAQVEPAGLFYSYSAPGDQPGRIAFLPIRTVLSLLAR